MLARYKLSIYTFIHMKKTQRRGAVTKSESKQIIVYFPKAIMPLIDRAVDMADTDRSKYIRSAVREKLGITA